MKRALSILLSLVMVFGITSSMPLSVSAKEGADYLSYRLSDDGKTYSVVDYKWFKDCDSYMYTDVVIPPFYKDKEVTSIGDKAFWEGDVTSVKMYWTIKSIGDCAFWSCRNLTSIEIPEGVKEIGENTFGACSNLKTVTLPESLTDLGSWAFGTCTSLTSIAIPGGVKRIKGETFQSCVSLSSVTIGDGIEYIGNDAFNSCKSLSSITIPDSVTYIGDHSFGNCTGLKSVTIPGTVTTIGEEAFGYIFNENYEYKKIGKFTITGIKNTAAEAYAKKNGFDFIEIECKHSTKKWVTAKKATANNPGLKQRKCTICKKVLESAKIPQLKCATPKLKSVTNTATGIKFTWNKVSGADSYTVYKKVGKGSWKAIKDSIKTTSFTDKNVKSGTTYKYTVKAKNEVGFSDYNTAGLTIKCIADPVLKAPTSTKKGIVLKWSKVKGAQGYVVYRKADNGNFTRLATIKGLTKITYTDKKAKKGVKYSYKIRAYSGKTYSAQSNVKTIKDRY